MNHFKSLRNVVLAKNEEKTMDRNEDKRKSIRFSQSKKDLAKSFRIEVIAYDKSYVKTQ